MYRIGYVVLLAWLLLACTAQDDAPPTATPEPTSAIGDYSGPLLGSAFEADESDCLIDSGCVSEPPPLAVLPASPLPLRDETLGEVRVGVAEGYQALQAGDEWLIVAEDSAAAGGFIVSLRAVDAPPAPPPPYDDQPTQTEPLSEALATRAEWREAEDGLLVYLYPDEAARVIVAEGFADSPANWQVFRPTFLAMLARLAWP